MSNLFCKPLGHMLQRTAGAAAITWALLVMLAVLAALSCLTVVGRLSAG